MPHCIQIKFTSYWIRLNEELGRSRRVLPADSFLDLRNELNPIIVLIFV